MKIKKVNIRNFRRLEDVEIDFEEKETVFVGPNNSGKTSATSAFKIFLKTQDFKIHDFSVSRIADIDAVGREEANVELPKVEMDLWVSVNPDMEFGRIFALLPNTSSDIERVGIRIQYVVKEADKLRAEYQSAFPVKDNALRAKSLSHYLSLPGNLTRHFNLVYWTLEEVDGGIQEHHVEAEEAKKTLASLIKVDFVDAQRNIDDHEAARSTRLSQAFATYYKMNLKQADVNEEANRIIEQNNENLNKHYKDSFEELMAVLKGLGVPSVNDRDLKLISSLSPEMALKGNTALLYVDNKYNHELPEAYNGLGFKNLVYIAIQVSHFYLQWISAEENRPLCQMIFIEEPEVHLHSQVQQTFISNIWKIIGDVAEQEKEKDNLPQICVSTHSSHILDAAEFEKIRYFKRCCLADEDPANTETLNASKILSMRTFHPNRASASGAVEDEKDVIGFLKKYMRLTHCDLFFSDAAILVEGAAEKLLLPEMIKKVVPELKSTYISVLEVGGAYANKFAGLLEFIGIPYLVITDIDSVDPNNNNSTCRADDPNAITSNSSIKFYLNETKISALKGFSEDQVKFSDNKGYIAFQKPTSTPSFGNSEVMYGRTFEECFIYENIESFKSGDLECGLPIPAHAEDVRDAIYKRVKSSTFKKTDFALSMASTDKRWETPSYISSGLSWLKTKLSKKPIATGVTNVGP